MKPIVSTLTTFGVRLLNTRPRAGWIGKFTETALTASFRRSSSTAVSLTKSVSTSGVISSRNAGGMNGLVTASSSLSLSPSAEQASANADRMKAQMTCLAGMGGSGVDNDVKSRAPGAELVTENRVLFSRRLVGPTTKLATRDGEIGVASREARAGIEPANSGFADRCLTTWLPRQRSPVTY